MILFQDSCTKRNVIYQTKDSNRIRKQSPQFYSKLNRFKSSDYQTFTPGPGSYQIPAKDIERTSKYKIKLQRSEKDIQHLWIMQDERFNNPQLCKSRHIGPGSYSPEQIQTPNKINYSFSKIARFNKLKQSTSPKLGPGVYNIECKNKLSSRSIVSPFKSQTQRFNSQSPSQQYNNYSPKMKLINPESELERKIRQENQILKDIKSIQELKQSIEAQTRKCSNSYIFKSKKPRFTKFKEQSIGPGYYQNQPNLKQLQKQRLFLIKNTQAQLKQKSRILKPVEEQMHSIIPGPNHYKINNHTIQKSIQKNSKGGYLSEETRFYFHKKSKSTNLILPGPGQYQQKKYMYIDKDSYIKDNFDFKSKQKSILSNSVPFLSSADRLSIEEKRNLEPFGYNSNIHAIEKKVQKTTIHLAKLKMMDFQLPAFNTKSKRV